MPTLHYIRKRRLREPLRKSAFQPPAPPTHADDSARIYYCGGQGGDVAGEGTARMRKKPLSSPGEKLTLVDQMVFVSTAATGTSCQRSLTRFDLDWTA